jgi:hypothetical protein
MSSSSSSLSLPNISPFVTEIEALVVAGWEEFITRPVFHPHRNPYTPDEGITTKDRLCLTRVTRSVVFCKKVRQLAALIEDRRAAHQIRAPEVGVNGPEVDAHQIKAPEAKTTSNKIKNKKANKNKNRTGTGQKGKREENREKETRNQIRRARRVHPLLCRPGHGRDAALFHFCGAAILDA